MRWAQKIKRVFRIDMETCPVCPAPDKIIASIEGEAVIERIPRHLTSKDLSGLWSESRAPPAVHTGLAH